MPQSRIRQGAVIILATLLLASTASAQQVDPADRQAFLSSVSSTTTTTVVGGVIITVTITTSAASLERYLRHNAVALRHDITRGAGATVDDLAAVFEVEADDRALFGRLLRTRRAALLELAAPAALDEIAAAKFAAIVREELRKAEFARR